ncbi:MAG: glycosyltransferase family 39 protein [Lentisphaerae bacterium]|nr:glycosyltransferase family 39 protein [Lentisphaerota bacterium]
MKKNIRKQSVPGKPAECPALPPGSRGILQAAALLAVALAARLLFLGRADLWQEEIHLLNISQPGASPLAVFSAYWNHCISIAQLPLAGVMQNVFMHMAGGGVLSSHFWLRFPAAALGALGVVGFFKLAELASGRAAAWMAGLFMALFFYPVYYSRELYCYAHVLCFSSFGLFFWLKAMSSASWKNLLPGWMFLAALGLSHFAGSFLIAAAGAVSGVRWLFLLFVRKNSGMARASFFAALMCAAAALPVLPYWIRILTHDNPHIAADSPYSIPFILNDGVGKLFLGGLPAATALSWLLLAAGLAAAARRRKSEPMLIPLASVMLVTMALLAVASKNSQYASARYFSPAAAPAYVFFALGVMALPRLFMKEGKAAARAAWICGGALLALHAAYYLSPMYMLKTKSLDFRAIAQWLNQNLEPGQPYLMESAYELRWVGGYFKTPGLTGASPYVHVGGPGELERLHALQVDFMNRFPEAPFIESAHHNAGTPQGIWTWPHENFRRHVRLANDELRALVRRGIYPGEPGTSLKETDFHTDIYYDTPEDRAAKARARGEPALFRWAGWNCVPYAQDPRTRAVEYCWAAQGASGKLEVQNLAGRPVTGRVSLVMTVAAPPGPVDVFVRRPPASPLRFRMSAGQFHALETADMEIPAGGATLESGVAPGARATPVQGLLIREARFVSKAGD